jgi:hypothetical protein
MGKCEYTEYKDGGEYRCRIEYTYHDAVCFERGVCNCATKDQTLREAPKQQSKKFPWWKRLFKRDE